MASIASSSSSSSSSSGESKDDAPLLAAGTYAPAPATARGAPSHLAVSPDGTLLCYAQGKNVVVRSVSSEQDPAAAFVFQGHKATTTVARFSPDGKWVASGDDTGWVRVWAWAGDGGKHAVKKEIKCMGKSVTDLAWGPDSKRLGVVGDGGKRARCVLAFSGSDQSPDMTGHIKKCLTLAYRQTKPAKIVTGGEDFQTIIHKGPPFRRVKSNKTAHRGAYINCLRFSPDGTKYCSVASDKKIVVYDAEDSSVLHTFTGHAGGVYGCDWTADGASIFTCSADKTCKLWSVADGACTTTFTISSAPAVGDMQVACAVAPTTGALYSLSLSGDINVLDAASPGAPVRVISGHNEQLKCMAYDAASETIVSADASGAVRCWAKNGEATPTTGAVHTKLATAVAVGGGRFYSAGWDNAIRSGTTETGAYDAVVSCGGQPKVNGLRCSTGDAGLAVVVSTDGVRLLRAGNEAAFVDSAALGGTPCCCDISPSGDQIAVGLEDSKKIMTFPVSGDALGEAAELFVAPGVATVIRYSPDGAHLAVADNQREIQVWNFESASKPIRMGMWKSHGAAVTALAWSPDNKHVASGSLDQSIFVWTLESKTKREQLPLAHMYGPVCAVEWADETTILSAGTDTVIKTWTDVKLP
jgi:WD40 repeat protein